MARSSMADLSPWRRRSLSIPPRSLQGWLQLAIWEIWMGVLLAIAVGLGVTLLVTAPDRVFVFTDLSQCYGPPPVVLPCERVVYRGGTLNVAFTALCGMMLLVGALWSMWELWNAVEPKPITDDFLKLLNDSFGRNWRNPFTWPWSRVLWAYGFTAVGAAVTAGGALVIWSYVAAVDDSRPRPARVHTTETFRVDP